MYGQLIFAVFVVFGIAAIMVLVGRTSCQQQRNSSAKYKTTRTQTSKHTSESSNIRTSMTQADVDGICNELLFQYLESNGITYIDNRNKSGALWIVGGMELIEIVISCKSKFNVTFTFKPSGAQCAGRKPAWWTTDTPSYRGTHNQADRPRR